MELAALFSGGKDSTFAVYEALKRGHKVKYLISIVSRNPESYMFHYPDIEYTRYQAEAMEMPLIAETTKGEKEKELVDLKRVLRKIKKEIDGISVGGLASRYQYERVKKMADSLNLKLFAPLWKKDMKQYWKTLLESGFKIMVVAVSCEGLGKDWLGRIIDRNALIELERLSKKHGFHLGFEGGEAETFVLDCPVFKKSIEILEAEKIWEGDSGMYLFKKIKLIDKR